MAMSNRERYMAIAVVAAFGLFAFDRIALTPYMTYRRQLAADQAAATQTLLQGSRVLQKQRAARDDWKTLQAQGLESDPSEVERRMQHWLHLWAQEAGVGNLSLRADRSAAKQSGFTQVTVHAAGTGPVAAVAKLLWRLEVSPAPVRVHDVQLSSGREGSDQVQVQLKVAALCVAPEAEPTGGRARAAAAARQVDNGGRL